MNIQLLIAVIAAIVALTSAILSIYGQIRLTKLQARIQKEKEERSKKSEAESLLALYNEPILNSAYELQGRFFNVLNKGFFQVFYRDGDENEKQYSINSTLYVLAQYFCWSEIMRQEIQILNLGEIVGIQKLTQLQESICQLFLSKSNKKALRIFRGEQRAIGELMITYYNGRKQCIGYATFVKNLQDTDFQKWFIKVKNDFDRLADELDNHWEYIKDLQNTLIDLIDFLDPEYKRYPKKYRRKYDLSYYKKF